MFSNLNTNYDIDDQITVNADTLSHFDSRDPFLKKELVEDSFSSEQSKFFRKLAMSIYSKFLMKSRPEMACLKVGKRKFSVK